MARILLTGARGMLGRRLHETLGAVHDLVPADLVAGDGVEALDITDVEALHARAGAFRPDWIVNAAAYTAVDLAEQEEEQAFLLNAQGAENVARAAARCGARVLHFSTDFVFDGEKPEPYVETDPTGPIGVYACSKEEGERLVREACSEHVIMRIAWLFGPDGKNFVDTMLRIAGERDVVRVVADQVGTPTFTRDAARTVLRIIEADLRGVIHGTNSGETTWAGLAGAAIEAAGLKTVVEPIATEDYPTPARRPANSRLENRALAESIGDDMRPWEAAVRAYVAER